jgi:carbonic anhydrase
MFRKNPDPSAIIIGNVSIGQNVFIGPGVVIRADEPGSSIIIEDNCNVQDRVIVHALRNSYVLIESNTSLAHGCIIHGPCKIGRNCFIGFGSVVFQAKIGEGTIIKHLSCVEGVNIPKKKVVESGNTISNKSHVQKLKCPDKDLKEFIKKVVKANLALIEK